VVNTAFLIPEDTTATPVPETTLQDVEKATHQTNEAAQNEADAYTRWTQLLRAEYDRQLLRPSEIYRAASISKQMLARFTRQTATTDTPTNTTVAHTPLPATDLGVHTP
jgi:hypothetical protein